MTDTTEANNKDPTPLLQLPNPEMEQTDTTYAYDASYLFTFSDRLLASSLQLISQPFHI